MTNHACKHLGRWQATLASLILTLVVTGTQAVIGSSNALAGTWMHVSCPASVPTSTPSEGWSGFSTGEPALASYTTKTCGDGWPLYATLGNGSNTPTGSSETLEYQPPTGSTLIGGSLHIETIGSAHGTGGAYGVVNIYTPTNTGAPIFSCGYLSCPVGSEDYSGEIALPGGKGGGLYVSASCSGPVGAVCKESADPINFANGIVLGANLLLENNATPSASAFAGGVMEPEARGTQNLELTATDLGGPGVYELTVEIDGHMIYSGTPDSNGGTCMSEGTASDGAMMFHAAQPCKQSEKVSIPLNTTKLADGNHTLALVVTDAARNSGRVAVGTISTHNAPENTSLPTILAPSVISPGVPLSSAQGQWVSPAETGGITETYQWQQCSATDSECQDIPDATSGTYMPATNDASHTLRLIVTAADADGETVAASVATSLVTPTSETVITPTTTAATPGAPNGDPASDDARIQLTGPFAIRRTVSNASFGVYGHLLSASGQPITGAVVEVLAQTKTTTTATVIGHVSTTAGGAFAAKIPAGPSRVIELTYRAFANDTIYAAQAKVNETVTAAVELRVTPRHTKPTGKIKISGRVLGLIPRGGVTVALEVWYLGHWVPFRDPTTDEKGRFSVTYQFEGARGTFPFRVKVLNDQAGFAYEGAYSKRVDVRTR